MAGRSKDLKFTVSADIDKLQRALAKGDKAADRYANRTKSQLGKAGSAHDRHGSSVVRGQQRIEKGFSRMSAAVKLGAAAGVYGLVQFAKSAHNSASDVTESITKGETLFGSYFSSIDSFSRRSAESLGVSRAAALEYAGVFGNLFRALKMGEKQSADWSVNLTELAADMASFNNTSVDDALDSIRSGLVGETEPLRKFGVNMNDATLRAKAMEMGLGEIGNTLTPLQKAQAAYGLIVEQTSQAHGDFEKTSEGNANQLRILEAQYSDLAGELGVGLLPVVNSVIGALNDTIAAFRDGTGIAGDFKDGVSDAWNVISEVIGDGVDAFNGNGDLIAGLFPDPRSFVDKLIDGIGGALGAIDWAGVMDFGESIKSGVEHGIMDAIANIDTAVLANLMLETTLDVLTLAMDPIWIANHIVEIVGVALAFSKIGILRKIPFIGEAFGKVGDYIIKGAKWGIQKAIPGLGRAIWEGVETAFESFYRQSPKLATKFGTVLGDVVNFFPKLAGKIRGSGGRILTAIGDGIKSRTSWLTANALQSIGRVVSAMVDKASGAGRAGREIVVSVWGGITRLSGRLAYAGRWVVGRIGDGISAAVSGLARIGKSIGNAIIDAAKSALGINSPSKVFREIGQHMVSGLAQGITPGNVRGVIGKVFGGMAAFVGGLVGSGAESILGLPGDLMKYAFGGDAAPGGIVSLGKMLQKMGYSVSENPAFGGVNGKHAPGSYHYKGRALDINADGAPGGEAAALDRLYGMLKVMPGIAELLWRTTGHFDHLHVAMRRGGKAGPSMGGADVVYGEGMKDEWWISQEGSKAQNTLWGIEALEAVSGKNVALFKKGGKKVKGKLELEKNIPTLAEIVSAKGVARLTKAIELADALDAAYDDPAYDVNLPARLQEIDALLSGKGLSKEDRLALLGLRSQTAEAMKTGSAEDPTPTADPQIFIDLKEAMDALTAKIGLVHETGAYELAQALIDMRNGNLAGSAADAFRLQPAAPRFT